MLEHDPTAVSTGGRGTGSNRILGIDFGLRRVGVAVSDPMCIIAQGLDTFPNDRDLPKKILELVEKMSISKIVIGKPLKLSGKEGDSALRASEFAELLRRKLSESHKEKIEIVEWDERFTTTIAQRTQIELGIKKKERQRKGKRQSVEPQKRRYP